MVTSQQAASSVRRDAWVEIDLAAIEHNMQIIKNWLSPANAEKGDGDGKSTALMAVVKSDAYGHGAVPVAEVAIASGFSWLAVASVDEGCQLRTANINVPILILSPSPFWAINTAIEYGLDITVTSAAEVKSVADTAAKMNKEARVHLKVDTGMHRLGCLPDAAKDVVDKICGWPQLTLVSVFSHLAKADDYATTFRQNQVFEKVVEEVRATGNCDPSAKTRSKSRLPQLLAHLASSDATRLFPFTHHDLVRVGLHIYGLESQRVSDILIPALSVRGRINHTTKIEAEEGVGYGLTWTSSRPTRLATIPIGYADGVHRSLSNRMSGLCMGQRITQVGRLSMDQMIFDITDIPQAQEGDVITLIGKDGDTAINLADWALLLDTNTYEMACSLRVRLPRIYTRHEHHPAKY
jgi:alanine racemase